MDSPNTTSRYDTKNLCFGQALSFIWLENTEIFSLFRHEAENIDVYCSADLNVKKISNNSLPAFERIFDTVDPCGYGLSQNSISNSLVFFQNPL